MKKRKVLMTTAWALSGTLYQSLLNSMMSIGLNADVDFLSMIEPVKAKDFLYKNALFIPNKIIPIKDMKIRRNLSQFNSWREYFADRKYCGDTHYDDVFLMGGPQLNGWSKKEQYTEMFDMAKEFDKTGFASFNQMATRVIPTYAVVYEAIRTGAHFHHLVFDPLEATMINFKEFSGSTAYFGYGISKLKQQRVDTYQHFMNSAIKEHIFEDFFDSSKKFDFAFGFTATTIQRSKIHQEIRKSLNVGNLKSKIFVQDVKLGIDTKINRDLYLAVLQSSKFTLVIKPYFDGVFSVTRFIEAIYKDCVPLIANDVIWEEFATSYNIDHEIFKELLVDFSTVGKKIESISEEKRLDLLNYFKGKVCQVEQMWTGWDLETFNKQTLIT